jgi:hypothetical protein
LYLKAPLKLTSRTLLIGIVHRFDDAPLVTTEQVEVDFGEGFSALSMARSGEPPNDSNASEAD